MFYLVYKITNRLNGKYYIGVHQTKNANDGYMGSGKLIGAAIQKYGEQNFVKEILYSCQSAAEMYQLEKDLVNLNENCYNIKHGGNGGFDHINNDTEFRIKKNKKARQITNERFQHKLAEWGSIGGKRRIELYGVNENFVLAGRISFLGKHHTEESKKIIGSKNSKHQKGSGNSQYGTMWITNSKNNTKIKKNSAIPPGWRKGRIIQAG